MFYHSPPDVPGRKIMKNNPLPGVVLAFCEVTIVGELLKNAVVEEVYCLLGNGKIELYNAMRKP